MTLGELRAVLRVTLGDGAAWPDASLDEWVRAGVRLYAAHFGPRAAPWADEDDVDVPDAHLEAVTAYVEFAALKALQVAETLVADGSSITLAQLGDQARRAWLRYKDVIDQLLSMTAANAQSVSWGQWGL